MVLALAYPICDSLLPETVKIAVLNPYDRENGIDKTCGFRFFKYEQSCLPLFQLLNCAQQPWSDRINTAALQNAVLYAREYNKNCIEANQIAELRHTPSAEPAIICSRRRMHDGRMFILGHRHIYGHDVQLRLQAAVNHWLKK